MFPLRPGRIPLCNVKNIIYIVRPVLSTMDIIAETVHKCDLLLNYLVLHAHGHSWRWRFFQGRAVGVGKKRLPHFLRSAQELLVWKASEGEIGLLAQLTVVLNGNFRNTGARSARDVHERRRVLSWLGSVRQRPLLYGGTIMLQSEFFFHIGYLSAYYMHIYTFKRTFLQECIVEDDLSSLFNVSRALMVIQALYGLIPNLHGKGALAKVGL